MDIYRLNEDIKLICVKAKSFPDGVLAAHEKLHTDFPMGNGRRYFGISYPVGRGAIEYKAAAEEMFAGEAEKHGYETFVIKQGAYTYCDIPDFRKDIPAIGKAFSRLLTRPDIDPNGCCVELYMNETDVRCMIRLA